MRSSTGSRELLRVLGIAVSKQLHRSLDVGEQHRDLLALALKGRPCGEDLVGQVLGRVTLRRGKAGIVRNSCRDGHIREQNFAVGDAWLPQLAQFAHERSRTLLAELRRNSVLVLALRAFHGNPRRKHRPGCAVTLAPLVDGNNLHTTLGQGNQANLRGPSTVVLNETVALPHLHDRRHLAMGELRMTLDGGAKPAATIRAGPRFSVSSLPAFGRPPWMKLSALPDLGYSVGAVGTKVGPSLVRQSPRVSWTRRPGRPPLARGSSDAPRARSLDVFFDQVTTPAASVWEEKGWTSFINV